MRGIHSRSPSYSLAKIRDIEEARILAVYVPAKHEDATLRPSIMIVKPDSSPEPFSQVGVSDHANMTIAGSLRNPHYSHAHHAPTRLRRSIPHIRLFFHVH